MTAPFIADMKRWRVREIRPAGSSELSIQLGAGDILRLLWSHPQLWATGIYRLARWSHVHRVRLLPTLLERLNMVLFGLELGPSIPIGPGLYIPHPWGTTVMARRIGANATFIHAITIGMRQEEEFPVLGDGVFIGAGARILGGIKLGDDCSIGANAVVIADVPVGATAVGVPARLVGKARALKVADGR